MNELAKLRWQCRRGMKELDLLLEQYLANGYLLADDAEKTCFAELLVLEDDELLAVLTNSKKWSIPLRDWKLALNREEDRSSAVTNCS